MFAGSQLLKFADEYKVLWGSSPGKARGHNLQTSPSGYSSDDLLMSVNGTGAQMETTVCNDTGWMLISQILSHTTRKYVTS